MSDPHTKQMPVAVPDPADVPDAPVLTLRQLAPGDVVMVHERCGLGPSLVRRDKFGNLYVDCRHGAHFLKGHVEGQYHLPLEDRPLHNVIRVRVHP